MIKKELLYKNLNKLGYIENYATGIKKTIKAYNNYEQKPEFISLDYFFLVKLPNLNFYIFGEDNPDGTIKLSDNAIEILNLIKENPSLTRKKLCEITKKRDRSISSVTNDLPIFW